MGYIKVLGLTIATLIMFYGCAKDEADCGGVINSGSITSSTFSANCANGNNNSGGGTGGGAGTTDRHDSTVTTTTTAPGG